MPDTIQIKKSVQFTINFAQIKKQNIQINCNIKIWFAYNIYIQAYQKETRSKSKD